MEFVTTKALLYQALSKAAAFVPTNPIHPILKTILIEAQDQQITFTGFDLQSGCVAQSQATVVKPGSVAINKQILSDLISRLSGDMKVHVDENFLTTITASTGSYQIAGGNPKDYMSLPAITPEIKFDIDPKLLKQFIKFTGCFYTNEPSKQILTGVDFKYLPEQQSLVAAATDSHKLAVQASSCDSGEKAFEVVIPGASLQKINRLLEGSVVSLEIDSAWLRLTLSSGDIVITRKLEGTYPKYESLVPKKFELEFTINRKELLSSLERVALFSNKKGSVVLFGISHKELELSAKDEGNSSQEFIAIEPAKGNGLTSFITAFNIKYLIEAIQSVSSDSIRIKLNQSTKPVIITLEQEEENTNSLILIMPIDIVK
jgi:DNA polymerase-3 subunit beta